MEYRSEQSRRIRNMLWMVLLSILMSVGLGAYWVAQVVDQLGATARKNTVALLELEEAVSDAAFTFTRQTQEWKDQLLRAHDAALFADHHRAMLAEAAAMQLALQRAKTVMQAQSLETEDIVSIEQQEQALLAGYAAALLQVDRNHPQYYRLVDQQVRGKDRALRDALTRLQSRLRDEISARVAVLGANGREQVISNSFVQIGLIAVLLPLLALFAFLRVYRALRDIGREDARIRTIYESIGDAVLVADTRGRVDTLNAVAQKLTGWSQQEAQGKPLSLVFQLFDASGGQRVPSPAERVLGDGRSIPISNGMILCRRDGSEVAVEDSAAPVLDEHGKMSAVVMVFHDVSQRYEMVRDLKHERALFRQTFDQAGVGMAQLSMDGRWTRVNRKLCEITGYSEEELLALSFTGVTYPDDLKLDVEALQDLLARKTQVYETEKRYVRKDGRVIWVELTVSIVWNEDGTPDYGISIIQDIQTRRDAELTAAASRAQYQALFDQMPVGVLLIGENMQVAAQNLEALRLLEYSSEEMRSLHVWDFEAMDDTAAIEQRSKKIGEAGRDDFESRYRTRSGRMLDVDVSVQLVHLADGKPVFQTLFRDVTEQIVAEG
jgi:PAS domain S-box-containing protein